MTGVRFCEPADDTSDLDVPAVVDEVVAITRDLRRRVKSAASVVLASG